MAVFPDEGTLRFRFCTGLHFETYEKMKTNRFDYMYHSLSTLVLEAQKVDTFR